MQGHALDLIIWIWGWATALTPVVGGAVRTVSMCVEIVGATFKVFSWLK